MTASPVQMGGLSGNHFNLNLRNLRLDGKPVVSTEEPCRKVQLDVIPDLQSERLAAESKEDLDPALLKLASRLRGPALSLSRRGFINYFGHQRVGRETEGIPRGVQAG